MVSTPSAAADASRAPDTESATWLAGCSGEVDTFRYRPGLRSPPGTRLSPLRCSRPSRKPAGSAAHGAGLITMADPRARDTWNELQQARRVESDPGRLDEFISVQLSQDAHDRIARALHWKRSPPSTREEPPICMIAVMQRVKARSARDRAFCSPLQAMGSA